MKKTRIFALILTAAMLCSCGSNAELEKLKAENEKLKEQTVAVAEESPRETASEDNADEQTTNEAEKETETKNPVSADKNILKTSATIEETVLLDEDDVKITANSLDIGKRSTEIKFTIENNSDKELKFSCYNCSVNGYTMPVWLYETVAAGKKSKESISIDNDKLTLCGISDIAELVFKFDVSEDLLNKYIEKNVTLTTSVSGYDYSNNNFASAVKNGYFDSDYNLDYFSEEKIMDEDGLCILSQAIVSNSDEKILYTEFENTTDETIKADIGDISINGLVVQSGNWSSDSIHPNARCISKVSLTDILDDHCDELFGINEISDIKFRATAYDNDYKEICSKDDIHIINSTASFDASGEELCNESGIRVVYKGLTDDTFSLSDDIHIWLLIENNSGGEVVADIDYDTLSLNGFMTSFICYSRTIPNGKSAALDIEVSHYRLEENDLKGIDDILEIEATIEVRDKNYSKIAKPVISIKP